MDTLDIHQNAGLTPDATEDTTTTEQEALVPYPVVNRADNHPVPDPKETFDFGYALQYLKKNGWKVARKGWNGKGMWLKLQVPDANSKMTLPYIYMKTADNQQVPWLASQTDVLAEDWVIIH